MSYVAFAVSCAALVCACAAFAVNVVAWRRLRTQLGKLPAERARNINPRGYRPEGHLCLVCLRHFERLEPPDHKICAGCLREAGVPS